MASLTLLQWILGALLLQVAAFMGLAFGRHWQAYAALREAAAKGQFELPLPAGTVAANPAAAAWAGYRPFRVRAKTLEDADGQVCSFELVPEDGQPLAPFLPGQFLTFRLDLPSTQGSTSRVVRCYSLSDAPKAEAYRVSIKRAPNGTGVTGVNQHASHYFHDDVKVGSSLQVRAPAGRFYLDRSQAPVVLIAGGIGITPMLSMVNSAMQEQPEREVWLFYGVREAAELVMLPQLQALAAKHPNFHLHLCFSGPPPVAGPREPRERAALVHQHHSRIDVRLLRSVLPLKPYHFYVCGPTALLVSLVPALEGWGVAGERIHFEAFGPASIPRRKAAVSPPGLAADGPVAEPFAVTFATSGKTCEWRPGMGSLLDFAEANGIEVASGCRSGSCGSCQTTIRAGQVRYARAPDHTPEPGSCLMCMSTPGTALTLDA